MVLKQLAEGRCEVENQYGRIVAGRRQPAGAGGDRTRCYELREFFEWRGLGSIDHSGVRLRAELTRRSMRSENSACPISGSPTPRSCQCGEVLKGVIKPHQCKVFGTACTPETPLGALMVSSEGACAAYYSYGRPTADVGTPEHATRVATTEPLAAADRGA